MRNGQLLVIDNYDSFTYNIVRYLQELGAKPYVIYNDQYTLAEIIASQPKSIVISPGPCTPDDAGISLAAIKYFSAIKTPILGVCLGHQAIGQVFGAQVARAKHVVHGKASCMFHLGERLFAGLPKPVKVGRYHSLVLEGNSIPDCLNVEAWLEDENLKEDIIGAQTEGAGRYSAGKVVMAIAHKSLPVHGVQYHPESILSECGHKIFENFLNLYGLIDHDESN